MRWTGDPSDDEVAFRAASPPPPYSQPDLLKPR